MNTITKMIEQGKVYGMEYAFPANKQGKKFDNDKPKRE